MNQSPITMEALLVLDAIERRGSFAAAAEQLNKVPSSLSYIVQKLEEQLSVTLFVRQGRRSVLTPAGRHLLAEGRNVLAAVSKLSEQTQTIAHGWEPRVRVAFDSIIPVEPIFQVIHNFLTDHPDIEIDLQEEVMSGGWESLIDDKVDLLVGGPGVAPKDKGITTRELTTLRPVFVVAKNHPLASYNRRLTTNDIAKYRTVIVHDSAQLAIPWSTGIFEQSQHFFVTSVALKIQAILAGLGGGYLPLERISKLVNSGELVALDVEKVNENINLVIAWKTINRGKGTSKLRQMLIDHFAYSSAR